MISSSGAVYFFIVKNTPFSIHLVIEFYWKKSDHGTLPSLPPSIPIGGNVVPGTVGAVVITDEFVSTSSKDSSTISKSAFS
mgnify:CR=1 FL=1